MALLRMQVRAVLRRCSYIDRDTLDKLCDCLERKWISSVSVYGLDLQRECCAEIEIKVDWDEYGAQLKLGKSYVKVPRGCENGTLVEVDEAARAFCAYVADYDLRSEWRVGYSPDVWQNSTLLAKVRGTLGTAPGAPIKWTRTKTGRVLSMEELPEALVGLYMAGE